MTLNVFIISIILAFLAFIAYKKYSKSLENWATSPGTIIQLEAKGPQDLNLMGLNPYYEYEYSNYFPYMYWRSYPFGGVPPGLLKKKL